MTTSWICHRGIRENGLIENTLEAFKLAVDRGFRVLETDLRLTQDGHIVLSHDPDFKRTLGDKRRIQDMSRAAIEALKASNGQKILFLDRFLDEFPDCAYVFDVKPETSRATLEALRAYLSQRADDTESPLVAKSRYSFCIQPVSQGLPLCRRERMPSGRGERYIFWGLARRHQAGPSILGSSSICGTLSV